MDALEARVRALEDQLLNPSPFKVLRIDPVFPIHHNRFPEELLVRILAYLSHREYRTCKLVCAKWDALRHRVGAMREGLFKPFSSPVASVDFSTYKKGGNNNNVRFFSGASIKVSDDGIRSLRIDRDGPYATIPIDTSPTAMPHCTFEIGLRLESIANDRGWVLTNEVTGFDRSVLMHDSRFGDGQIASAVGREWSSGMGPPPLREWIHVVATFQQNDKSRVYLNGSPSPSFTVARNRPIGCQESVWIGRPHHGGHYCDCWVKHVKIYDSALGHDQIATLAKEFSETILLP
mmetsp:Transcript_8289/g.9669  ORF Transcript_8289/g.9669 Transcript_8289/m.9669 type:complete len:291 (+) Transcript_8289:132-1004(+)|eukprot:CAMPEP_0198265214 /NCGR_PEP_ID=MMETSP1447-20131203/21055_1 /TAXON_ID=420782 /ORGANISM="Chaetoceros dichaeta, Strain CCMP1751" /LENGTH=290 /DNA_ID=CAMNT_0043954573 /DNA_START=116 /DNA_END=988 /DNA_ORIENTATION=-